MDTSLDTAALPTLTISETQTLKMSLSLLTTVLSALLTILLATSILPKTLQTVGDSGPLITFAGMDTELRVEPALPLL
jgi:hypothetical protein